MKKEWTNYVFLTVGSFLLALGVVGFLSPNSIATGGIAGLSIILNKVFNISIGLLFALINIPLLLVSVKYLGKYFAFKTTIAIALITIFIEVLTQIIPIGALSTDTLLATLYGGIIIGAGIGLVFKGGGSAGGGSLIARIINTKKPNIKPSTVILILDAFVIIATGFVFKSIELSLWSMISIYASSKMIDLILTGRPNEKIVHISSFKNLTELGNLIIDQIGASGTLVNGKNLSYTENKDLILVAVPKNRLEKLKTLVQIYDPEAKMIIVEATHILGVR